MEHDKSNLPSLLRYRGVVWGAMAVDVCMFLLAFTVLDSGITHEIFMYAAGLLLVIAGAGVAFVETERYAERKASHE